MVCPWPAKHPPPMVCTLGHARQRAPPTLGHVEGGAQREVDGEPAEHVGGVGGRVDGQVHILVQLRIKVAREAVAHCTARSGEGVGRERGQGCWLDWVVSADSWEREGEQGPMVCAWPMRFEAAK